jgi:hypothetical protein
LAFSPNLKVSYDVTKRVALGFEYYGDYGSVTGFDPLRDQQQQILPAVDIDFGPNWEFNFGVGIGMTQATDHLLIKGWLRRNTSDRALQITPAGLSELPRAFGVSIPSAQG